MERSSHGEGVFYDGGSNRRRTVRLTLRADGLDIAEGETRLALWRWEDLRRVEGPSLLRLSSAGGPELARLDIADADLAQAVRARAPGLDKGAGTGGTARIVLWSLAAAASLAGLAFFGMPLLADALAPHTPAAVERKLGDAVDNQLRAILGKKTCEAAAGRAALDKLVAAVSSKVPTRFPLAPAVLDSSIPNAVALPGGRIYVFRGLLADARTPDELAGVLAHEVAHVAHHDSMRRLIQSGGTSYLIGLLFGDVSGSAAVLTLARELAGASYSREAESRADATAIAAMQALGRSPVGLGELLQRLSPDSGEPGFAALLRSHPLSSERLAAVRRADAPASGPPLLSESEWASLKTICGEAR